MILVDSNIPMYLVGSDHPSKINSMRALERIVGAGERLVTDAEVLQEILHRYRAIDRRDAIQPAFDALLGVVESVLPIEVGDVDRARDLLLGRWSLSARDALHVAIMERNDVEQILSFDQGFDQVPGITRLS